MKNFIFTIAIITITAFSAYALNYDSSSGNDPLGSGTSVKNCANMENYSSFPFFKRVCETCDIQFTKKGGSLTCSAFQPIG